MFGFLNRKKKREASANKAIAAGVRNDSDRTYRNARHAFLSGNGTVEPDVLDSWVVEAVVKNDEHTTLYLPRPLWDDEAMLTRDSFETKAEAENYVDGLGGVMLESMPK